MNTGLNEVKSKIHADILQTLQKVEKDLRAYALDTIKPFLSLERQLCEADRKVHCLEIALKAAMQDRAILRAYACGGDHHDAKREHAHLWPF